MPMWSRYHILSISVWFYCLLVTLHYQLCATTSLFYANLKQHDRLHYWSMQKCFMLTWSTQINEDWRDISITPALCMSHSCNHCLDTLCWSNSMADEAYKIAICGNSLQHIRVNRYRRYLALPIPVWKICVLQSVITGIEMPIHLSDIRFPTE